MHKYPGDAPYSEAEAPASAVAISDADEGELENATLEQQRADVEQTRAAFSAAASEGRAPAAVDCSRGAAPEPDVVLEH